MRGPAASHADLVASALAAEGIQRCYGLPGGEVIALIDACRRRQIEFHLVGHEASAAFMAGTEGRIMGRPGVCIGTLGPGAMNLVTGVANAFLDREPLLAFTATLPLETDPGYTHQRVSLSDLFAPITKRSLLLDGRETEHTVRAAMVLARAGRPGPVHLALPSDLARAEAEATDGGKTGAEDGGATPPGLPETLEEAANLIAGAARPLVIVGLGVDPRRAGPALAAFIDAGRFPWVTTPKIKGIVGEDHPRWMGIVGGMAGDAQVRELLQDADLLIAIGFDPVESDSAWFVGRRVLAIDSVDVACGGYRPEVQVLGNLAEILGWFGRRVGAAVGWDPELLRRRKEAVRVAPAHPAGTGGLSPAEAIAALRHVFPRDGILTCDVGAHKLLLGQLWTTYEPLTFFMSNGLSSMGYGLPAAAAAQLCFPQRSVCCVAGDGGMLMTAHMLEYLRRQRLPVVTVVFTDNSLSLIRLAQERQGLRPTGVEFKAPAFAAMAQAFGVEARRVTTLGELSRAFAAALEAREPWLLDVSVDGREYAAQM